MNLAPPHPEQALPPPPPAETGEKPVAPIRPRMGKMRLIDRGGRGFD